MKYRSKFERKIHSAQPHLLYEPKDYKLDYKVKHTYQVDFIDPDEPNIYYEAKGYFRSGEARKYVEISKQYPDITFYFILMNPNNAMPGAKVRKCGTKLTMSEWCDKHGFGWGTL